MMEKIFKVFVSWGIGSGRGCLLRNSVVKIINIRYRYWNGPKKKKIYIYKYSHYHHSDKK